MKPGDAVRVFGKVETVLAVEEKRITTLESARKNKWYHPSHVFPIDWDYEMPDGDMAKKEKLEGETVYWQGEGFYTIVHNPVFWGYVKMDEAWMEDEPDTEYRILTGDEFDK